MTHDMELASGFDRALPGGGSRVHRVKQTSWHVIVLVVPTEQGPHQPENGRSCVYTYIDTLLR